MPPRKIAEKARAKPQIKPKKGVTKKLPKAMGKAKIPPTTDLCVINNTLEPENVPPKSKGKLNAKNELKIMRANEVLRTVFKKKPKPVEIKVTYIEPPKPQVKRRPGRQKKICDMPIIEVKDADVEPTNTVENNEPKQDVAKKKTNTRALNRKRCATIEIKINDIEHQEVQPNEPTEETPKKRRKLSLKRKTLPGPEKEAGSPKVTATKGKEETQESQMDKVNHSNETDVVSKTNQTQSQEVNIISCRKNSSSSASTCLSWTKDISSSSAVTCVTVQSGDFVRIDKKLPIIKLTDIDSKIKRKDTNDNIYDEISLDNHEPECKSPNRSEYSEISATDLNLSQTLNLSTSSMTSVRSVEATPKNTAYKNKEIVAKLQQSLDNLSSKMKNFDLEMINWIGYENESKDASTEKYNARILEILKEESEVIKYCKEIKRVLGVEDEIAVVTEKESNNINEITQPLPDCNKTANDALEYIDNESNKEKADNLVIENEEAAIKDSNSPDHIETRVERKSFDKGLEVDNTEDDDAISLFADTMADTDDFDDFDISPPKRRDKFAANERLSQTINQYQQPQTNIGTLERLKAFPRTVCEKQTADSSSNYNRNDSGIGNGLENNINEHIVNNLNNVVNRLKFANSIDRHTVNGQLNLSNKFGDFRFNDTNTNMPVNFNKTVTEFQNIKIRAPVNSFDQRFSQIPNNTNQIFSDFPDNFNSTGEIVDSDNFNDRPSDSTSKGSMVGADTYSVEQFKHPALLPTPTGGKQVYGAGSCIFKNICIFNLASICNKPVCPFPHVNIEVDVVKSRLQGLSEDLFIRECSYMLNWTVLRRKYGRCYVEECVRRDLTPWLLHITIAIIKDSRRKFNDKNREYFRVIEVVEMTLLHLNNANLDNCAEVLRSNIGPKALMCDYFMKAISETQNFSRFKNVFIKLTVFMCRIGRSFSLDVASQVLERLCILPYDESLARVLIQILERTSPNIFSVAMIGLFEMQLSANNAQLYERFTTLKGRLDSNMTQSPHASPNAPVQASSPVVRADSPDTTNVDSMTKTSEPVITRTITINRTINAGNMNTSSGNINPSSGNMNPSSGNMNPISGNMNMSSGSSDSTEPKCKVEQRWRYSPSVARQRHVYKRWGPRKYGNAPKFRRPPQL